MRHAHLSNTLVRHALEVLALRRGPEAVPRLLEAVGESRPLAQLEDVNQWSSYHQARAILEGVAAEVGGSERFRDLPEMSADSWGDPELLAFFRSLGSPAEILRVITLSAAKFATVITMVADEVDDGHAVVSAWNHDGFPRYQALCDVTAGMLRRPAELFGMRARVTEERCEIRGDARCVYRVTWSGDEATDAERRAASLEAELRRMAARFDGLRETVADLVSLRDIDEVLDQITARTARAVRAPAYLLAVHIDEDGPLRVHQRGIAPEHLEHRTRQVLAADGGDASVLVVEVASQQRSYGRLAAMFPAGMQFFPEERSLLAAYARLAAVALDAVTSVRQASDRAAEAERNAATSRALLGLSRRLAEVVGQEEVAERLAEATLEVVDCDRVSVLLHEPAQRVLRMAAFRGFPDEVHDHVGSLRLRMDNPVVIERFLVHEDYVLYTPDTEDEQVRATLSRTGTTAIAVVPIRAQGRLYGLMTVGVVGDAERLTGQAQLGQRLRGLADQAATALHNAELLDRVRHQALHDPVTGLPNARLLEDRLQVALTSADRRQTSVAVLFCDLDHFKVVNDSFGHAQGDEVLRIAADRVVSTMRSEDTVARIGGDEFVVLLGGDTSAEKAGIVAAALIEAFAEPFRIGSHQLFLTPSIGVAVSPADGTSPADLLRAADAAMYDAKAAGRATWRAHAPRPSPTFSRVDLDADLHSAIERGELRLYLQPQVLLATGTVCGVEALVRWQHPVHGLVPPDAFLPLAEETGYITHIDAWMLEEAARVAASWRARGLAPVRFAVNACERDLRHGVLPERVERFLAATGLAPDQLEVEITERIAAHGGDWMSEGLGQLAETGVRLAVDDFGTGTSTLGRLSQWDFDVLKVDRSFVRQIRGSNPAPLVSAVVALAHSLDADVVAEGVETEQQARHLRGLGCDMAQGWLFGRPAPPEDVAGLLAAPDARRPASVVAGLG